MISHSVSRSLVCFCSLLCSACSPCGEFLVPRLPPVRSRLSCGQPRLSTLLLTHVVFVLVQCLPCVLGSPCTIRAVDGCFVWLILLTTVTGCDRGKKETLKLQNVGKKKRDRFLTNQTFVNVFRSEKDRTHEDSEKKAEREKIDQKERRGDRNRHNAYALAQSTLEITSQMPRPMMQKRRRDRSKKT